MFSGIIAWRRRSRAIRRLVGCPDDTSLTNAVEQLILLNDRKALPALLKILGDQHRPTWIRAAACAVVGELGNERHIATLTQILLKRTNWKTDPFALAISDAAAVALQKLGWAPQTVEQRVAFAIGTCDFDSSVAEGEAAVQLLSWAVKAYESTNRLEDASRANAALQQIREMQERLHAAEAAAHASERKRCMKELVSQVSKWPDAKYRQCSPVETLRANIKEAGFDRQEACAVLAKLFAGATSRERMLIEDSIASEIIPLIKENREPTVVQRMLMALHGCEKLAEPLNRMFANGDAAARVSALQALSLLGLPQGTEVFEKALCDPDATVRRAAIAGLERLRPGVSPESLLAAFKRACDERASMDEITGITARLVEAREPRVVPLLIGLFKDRQRYSRKMELAAFREMGDRRAIGPLMDELPCDNEAAEIMDTLAAIDKDWSASSEAEGLVARLLESPLCRWHSGGAWEGDSRDSWKCERSLDALRHFRRPDAIQRLHDGLEHGFPIAAEVLGEIGDAESIQPLLHAMSDPHLAPQVAKSIDKLLQDYMPQVKTCDLERIATMSDPRGLVFVRCEEVQVHEDLFATEKVYDAIVVSCENLRNQPQQA